MEMGSVSMPSYSWLRTYTSYDLAKYRAKVVVLTFAHSDIVQLKSHDTRSSAEAGSISKIPKPASSSTTLTTHTRTHS